MTSRLDGRATSEGVSAKIQGMMENSEEWKNKRRHSQVANGANTQAVAPDAVVKTPISARLQAMQEDAEAWKNRQRHSLRKDTVIDPTDTGTYPSSTSGGHQTTIKFNRKNTNEGDTPSDQTLGSVVVPGGRTVQMRTTKGGHVVRATVRVSPSKANESKPTAESAELKGELLASEKKNPDELLYTNIKFQDGTGSDEIKGKANPDDAVIYATNIDFAKMNIDNKNNLEPNKLNINGTGDDSSDESEPEDPKVLYDNEDYVGTKGFGNKSKKVIRRKKKEQSADVVPTETVVTPSETSKNGEGDDSDSDLDPEQEEKMLYDNDDYTGRHPNLQKRGGVNRRHKTD